MNKIGELIKKYNAGLCTDEEKLWVEQWYNSFEWDESGRSISDEKISQYKEDVWQAIQNTAPVKESPTSPPFSKSVFKLSWRRIAAAAAIITAVITAALLLNNSKNKMVAAITITPKKI